MLPTPLPKSPAVLLVTPGLASPSAVPGMGEPIRRGPPPPPATQGGKASVKLSAPTLEPLHFGEFLLERCLISEEQWLAALAEHWSADAGRVGATLIRQGVLSPEVVEAEAARFHNELDVVELQEAVDVEAADVVEEAPAGDQATMGADDPR